MMQKDAARRTAAATPVQSVRGRNNGTLPKLTFEEQQAVLLDEPFGQHHKAFIATGKGRPALHMQNIRDKTQTNAHTGLCDLLKDPTRVMRVGVQVLEGNYPNSVIDATRSNLPQLIKSLCDFLDELSSLK